MLFFSFINVFETKFHKKPATFEGRRSFVLEKFESLLFLMLIDICVSIA